MTAKSFAVQGCEIIFYFGVQPKFSENVCAYPSMDNDVSELAKRKFGDRCHTKFFSG